MNRMIPIAAAALALVLGGGWYLTQGGASNTPAELPMSANAQDASEVDTSSIVEMVQGNPDAKVEVIEYASYTCPHCANFHTSAYKELRKNYIDTGKIKFVYREVYFDKYGMWASMIARCGGAEKFFGITDLIYAGQKDWSRQGSELGIANALRKIGRVAGLEESVIETCLQDGDKVRTLVAWFQENAQRDDISSTPSFIINGTKYTNMNYTDFAAILDAELAE